MPHFASLLPMAPAAPAAATPGPAVSAAAPGTVLPTDPTSPNFLAQFKAALKTIASVVVQPPLLQRPATDPNAVAPLMSAEPEPPEASEADKPVEASMPDLLSQLGFALVPTVFPILATPLPVATGPAGPTPAPQRATVGQLTRSTQSPASPGPVMVQASAVPLQAPADAHVGQLPNPIGQPLPVPTPPAATLPEAHASQTLPAAPVSQTLPDAQLAQAKPTPLLDQALAELQLGQLLPQSLPSATPVTHHPIAHLKPADQPQAPTPAPGLSATVMLAPTPAAQPPTAASPALTSAPPQIGFPQPAAQGGSTFSDTSGSRDSNTPDKLASVAAEATPVQAAPVSDTAMAAAAATTVNAAPVPVQAGPSQVVTQIARHADLIRLPGNRGLHIQLHPDDLGGVQVTVRYSPAGGVELHINAEHAATGALVQAGWTELRDALATHGISADRLMLSVTTPTGAGQADLSGSGGNRSDPNYANSSQGSLSSPDGQSQGQSRQDNPPPRTSQTWSNGLEPIASTDDNPRVASATGTPSRIDYRV